MVQRPFRLLSSLSCLIIVILLHSPNRCAAQTDGASTVLQAQTDEVRIENLKDLNSKGDEGTPFISPTDGSIYFSSNRAGKFSIYVAKRQPASASQDKASHWADPALFAELPEKQNLSSLSVAGDGVTSVVGICNRPDGILGTCDLYQSEYSPTALGSFASLGHGVNTEWWDGQPCISQDGQLLFFASDRKGGRGGSDIYMSSRSAEGKWSDPIDLSFNTGGNEMSPFISKDNQTLYFAANHLPGGLGGYDIYVSRRIGQNEWTAPKNLGATVNSKSDEMFFYVPPNEDAVYFCSDRDGGTGWFDIYRLYVQPAPPKPKYATLTGRILDAETGQPIGTKAEVAINLARDNSELTNSGAENEYKTEVLAGSLIRVKVAADAYVSNTLEIQAPAEPGSSTQDIKLTPAHARVSGHVTNVFSKNAVRATVVLVDSSDATAQLTTESDPRTGAYSFNISALKRYHISAMAPDYEAYNSSVDAPRSRETTLIQIEKEIRMTPSTIDNVMIFFDFNKSDLKPEEQPKFARFIQQVKENPYVRIEVNGHTDDVGSTEYNEKLSERRAITVEDYLLSRGVPRDQLAVVKGFGKSAPLDPGTTDEARAKNRRVEVRIVGKQD
jgi:outer membrane protein OmpA-like peptidoglycan-associated protein